MPFLSTIGQIVDCFHLMLVVLSQHKINLVLNSSSYMEHPLVKESNYFNQYKVYYLLTMCGTPF